MGDTSQPFSLTATRHLTGWLADNHISLAFTTYQSSKLFFIGTNENQELSVFERTFNRCMGLHVAGDGHTLHISTLYQLWRLEQSLRPGDRYKGYDAVYIPQLAYTTGDLDVHDIGMGTDGKPIFVNTLFSCLATVSETHSFRPLWQPPFISKLAPEDRCHLNGLAMEKGEPRFASSISTADIADGWRDHRRGGGVVISVPDGQIVTAELSMPHSPRLAHGRLWVLNSGTGHFGYIDIDDGRFEPVCFCPGYLRGMSIHERFAVVGLSLQRENRNFSGLDLDDELLRRNAVPRCGLLVIDLDTGEIVHSMRIEGKVEELYDVAVIPGIRRPMAIGLKNRDIQRTITVEEG